MTTDTFHSVDRTAVEELSRKKNEPEWLLEMRLKALQLSAGLELPKLEKTKIDNWAIDALGQGGLLPVDGGTALPADVQSMITENAGNQIVYQDGNVISENIEEQLRSAGVIFTSMDNAIQKHPDLVKEYLMQAIQMDEHKLSALHAALWTNGVFIYVPANVQVDVPVQALMMTEGKAAFAPHILIVAEANSKVTYVDHVFMNGTADEPLVHNGMIEVFAKPGAKVQVASVHNLHEKVIDVSYRRALLDQDAGVEWIIGEMNDGNTVSDTTSLLKGNGSTSDAKVVCIGNKNQKLNLTTTAKHFGLHSDSQMITRAVMLDEANAIINGITKIEHGATNANGEQTERILMLSPRARGDANPMLLIDEDEVTAGHAASVGQVDELQIFYLTSRGISREMAEKLIVYGFLEPVVSRVPIKAVAEQLKTIIERKLK